MSMSRKPISDYKEFLHERAFREQRSMVEIAVQLLRKYIIEGKLKPGSRISVRELAEFWGISRTPIREAIRRLETEGLVITLPRRGTVVRRFTAEEIEDVYTVRLALEPLAVKLAIPKINDIHFERILSIHEGLKGLFNRGADIDFLDVAYLNKEFHFSIYEVSENRILCETIENLWHRIFALILRIIATPGRITGEDIIREHERIIRALRSRSEEEAVMAIRNHIESTRELLLRQVKEL